MSAHRNGFRTAMIELALILAGLAIGILVIGPAHVGRLFASLV